MREKFNHPFIDDLVGIPGDDSEKKNHVGKSVERYMRRYGTEKHEGELEKTEHDIEIIQFAIDSASELMSRYGREKDVDVDMDHIHIMPVGGTEIVTNGTFRNAAQSSTQASFIVDRNPSDVQFCLTVFHEALHLKSYTSLQIMPPEQKGGSPHLKTYRSGFSVVSRNGEEKYFIDIEEGIVGLLTKNFFIEKIKQNSLFFDELQNTNSDYFFSRQDEIDRLYKMVDHVWNFHKDQFVDRSDVLDLFIKAQVTGNLLAVGKLVEQAYGKGGFRKIGEGFYGKDV